MKVYNIKEAYFDDTDVVEIEDYLIYLEGHLTTSDNDYGENLEIYVEFKGTQIFPDYDEIIELIKKYEFEFNDKFKKDLKLIIEETK